MKNKHLLVAAAVAAALGLTACGGGGGGAGVTGATTTQGVITGFGSVFVNGVEYNSNATNVTVNGVAEPNDSKLEVGMVVTVKGNVDPSGKTGTAASITYADDMEGVVTANGISAGSSTGTLTVMGQIVNVNATTVFDGSATGITTPDQIAVGNVVEVSGYASSTGIVTATRIEVKAAKQSGAEIEVKGTISALDTTAKTFKLGALTVDYSGVAAVDLPTNGLADGAFVEVKSVTVFDGTAPLVASKVELEDNGVNGHDGTEGEDIKIDGLVTAGLTNNQFEINGRTIGVTSSTEYDNGTAADLVTNAKADVEAQYDANGNLVATSIEFADSPDMELAGTVDAVDATAGTLTIMGEIIYVDNSTMMVDDSMTHVRYFHLSNISPADYVELAIYKDPTTGHLVASKLQREDGGSSTAQAMVSGVVTVNSNGTWTVAGVTVNISGATAPAVMSGSTSVEVHGSYDNVAGVLNATTIAP